MRKLILLCLAMTMIVSVIACGNRETSEKQSQEITTGTSEKENITTDASTLVNDNQNDAETVAVDQKNYNFVLIYVGTSEECNLYKGYFESLKSDGYIADYKMSDETTYQPHGVKTGFKAFVLNGIGDIFVYGESAHTNSIPTENIEPGDGYVDTLRDSGFLAFELTGLTIDEIKENIQHYAEQ